MKYGWWRPASPAVGRSTLITSAPSPARQRRQVRPGQEVRVVDDADARERKGLRCHECAPLELGSAVRRTEISAAAAISSPRRRAGAGSSACAAPRWTTSPFWLMSSHGMITMPQPGLLFDARISPTRNFTCSVSPILIGSRKSQFQPSDIPGRKRYSAWHLRPSATRKAEQAVRHALAEVRLPRVLLVDVQRRVIAGDIGIHVDHRAGDRHRRAHRLRRRPWRRPSSAPLPCSCSYSMRFVVVAPRGRMLRSSPLRWPTPPPAGPAGSCRCRSRRCGPCRSRK